MAVVRFYKKLQGITLLHGYFVYWPPGGSYNWWDNILIDETFPASSNLDIDRYLGNTVSTTEVSIGWTRWIYPMVYKNVSIIDGYLEGYLTVGAYNLAAGQTAHITQIIMDMYIEDLNEVDTQVGSYSFDITDLSFPDTLTYIGLPFVYPLSNVSINYNERFVIYVRFYGYSSGGTYGSNFVVGCENGTDDFYISVPFV